jgi:hypothetical protein
VKGKLPTVALARDLYTSPLFLGRRRAVERSCDRWFILSAKHGLVDPDQLLEPYDETLTAASEGQRRRWSRSVLAELERRLGILTGVVFEAHAGSAYLDHGLASGLEARGAKVERPVEGLALGQQLAFYRRTAGA